LAEYGPNETTREERAMKLHQETLKQWDQTSKKIAAKVGRDPSTLAMNSEDVFRRANEERYLISQVVNLIAQKDTGVWNINPKIGDLYAQVSKPNFAAFETIGNPEQKENAEGQRPKNWFNSKYYKKMAKQLRGHIEKIKPFDPDFSGLIVIGKPLELTNFEKLPEVVDEKPEVIAEENSEQEEEAQSIVKVNLSTNRLFFTMAPGVTQSKNVEVRNEGTCAIYYKWELARDIDLMIGSGANRAPIRKPIEGAPDPSDSFDWRASDSFTLPKDIHPRTRSEFLFTQRSGSILPGDSAIFSFSFKSDIPGCFTQRWVMRVTPTAESDHPLTVNLRGCCEVEPPDLSSFKKSIDESLHESERSRCIEEILSVIFDRVEHITAKSREPGEERIEGDVLVDDRAPLFDAANKKWGVTYSPGLYESFLAIAEEAWDSLDITGFERYWDSDLTSLSKLVLRITDGEKKRQLLYKINEVLKMNMTQSSSASLSFSIAYVQLSTMLYELPELFAHAASGHDIELPPFVAPKVAEPEDDELESTRRKHKKGREPKKQTSKKSGKKGSKDEEAARAGLLPSSSQKTVNAADIPPELRSEMVSIVKEQLKLRFATIEQLAGESRGVTKQLTRINEVDRLDTNLDAEVDDDL
jgi:hypothetical protein